ncbi:MAG: AmmeMemoRadiSam system protein B [Candidatus Omnitrophica bacterium]|jgi:hypothetical protein|nr:AmmeMemoRadiSam system protein B [Candidatus Omnitrophota bacterium]
MRHIFFILSLLFLNISFAQEVKLPDAAGGFYPDDPKQLSDMIDACLKDANPKTPEGRILAIIAPHAGYGFSAGTAAFSYKLVEGTPYKTVIIIGPSHFYSFAGVSVYPSGVFRTALGDVPVDSDFTAKLLNQNPEIIFDPKAFEKEHSVEVQLPFLQKTLVDFKIVPIAMGDCTLGACQKLSDFLSAAIGARDDVLVVVSSDLCHSYNYHLTEKTDRATLDALLKMDDEAFYYGVRDGKFQACGAFPIVVALKLAKAKGFKDLEVLKYTNSTEVISKKEKGVWSVGYAASVISAKPEGENMLDTKQQKRLLQIARQAIIEHFKGKKAEEIKETDPDLSKPMGSFVTLHNKGKLRGCIGNIIGGKPLYLTVRDMAIAASTQDYRFSPVEEAELKDIDIEISVLSVPQRVASAEEIQLGKHGVIVKRDGHNGVFLPQVATETGWTKEEFLSELCQQKAGLAPSAWKDPQTELYIFTAQVFKE